MSNINLDDLDRSELIELQAEIKERIKSYRPYRIKERMIVCGKKRCWCADGPDKHGPYLSAVYRDHGVTKSVSIGPKLTCNEMIQAVPGLPSVENFLLVPDHKYVDMSRSDTLDWVYITLSSQQFFDRYGVTQEEDNFNRPSKFWGPRDGHERYKAEHDIAVDRRCIPDNQWAPYGVSTLAGIAILATLEARGYYLKT